MMLGLDTNVLLRWLIDSQDAPEQTDLVSKTILESEKTCFVNAVVLAETIWVVGQVLKQSRSMQSEIVSRLLLSYNVEVSDRHAIEQALASFQQGGGGFVDHFIGAQNRLAGCDTTLTFDKKAAKSDNFTQLS
jgi:predicted nucleic-acid-binding protein